MPPKKKVPIFYTTTWKKVQHKKVEYINKIFPNIDILCVQVLSFTSRIHIFFIDSWWDVCARRGGREAVAKRCKRVNTTFLFYIYKTPNNQLSVFTGNVGGRGIKGNTLENETETGMLVMLVEWNFSPITGLFSRFYHRQKLPNICLTLKILYLYPQYPLILIPSLDTT